MNTNLESGAFDGVRVSLMVSQTEVEKLLDLVGHDGTSGELVVRMYLCLMAYSKPEEELALDVSQADVLAIHKVFTPTSFGAGGREFRNKLGGAMIEIEREEYLNGK